MPFTLKVGIKKSLISTYIIVNQQLSHHMQDFFGVTTVKGLPTLYKPVQFFVGFLAWLQEHHSLYKTQHTAPTYQPWS